MKHRKIVISILSITILMQIIGVILNQLVISANGGMPAIACATAFGKWVPIDQGTILASLSDVIQVGILTLSPGDLFIITALAAILIILWIYLPSGRKYFPLLILSILGIIYCVAQLESMFVIILFETIALGTILLISWTNRSAHKKDKQPNSG